MTMRPKGIMAVSLAIGVMLAGAALAGEEPKNESGTGPGGSAAAATSSTDQRLSAIEQKLDRILGELAHRPAAAGTPAVPPAIGDVKEPGPGDLAPLGNTLQELIGLAQGGTLSQADLLSVARGADTIVDQLRQQQARAAQVSPGALRDVVDRLRQQRKKADTVPRDEQVSQTVARGPRDAGSGTVEPEPIPPDSTVYRGRVVGPDGGPVFGAVVERVSADEQKYSTHTDADGNYSVIVPARLSSTALKFSASGLARQFLKLGDGPLKPSIIRLKEGAVIDGRILYRGRPLSQVDVYLVASDRTMPEFPGESSARTDAKGRFKFSNVPQSNEYDLYFSMASLQNFGAIPPRHVRIGPNGIELDLGDIDVGPAHRIAGRLAFPDGQAIPEGTIAYVNVAGGWDSVRCPVGDAGKFELNGLPTSTASLWFVFENNDRNNSTRRLSAENRSLKESNQSLQGKVDHDITDLVVKFDAVNPIGYDAPVVFSTRASATEDPLTEEEREARPLAGVERNGRKQ